MDNLDPTQIWLVICLVPAIIFFLGVIAGRTKSNKSSDFQQYLPGRMTNDDIVKRAEKYSTIQQVEDNSNE